MNNDRQRELDQLAFRRLSPSIDQSYAAGQFVAICGGQIVADAESFEALQAALTAMGKNPANVLIIQAGVTYPETAVIFLPRMAE